MMTPTQIQAVRDELSDERFFLMRLEQMQEAGAVSFQHSEFGLINVSNEILLSYRIIKELTHKLVRG